MSISSSIVDQLLGLHDVAAYSLVGGLAFSEAALLIGFVVPGETAVILGGVLAARHSVSLPLMIAVAIIAAITGDSVGYEVGKSAGPRLTRSRLYAGHQAGLDRGFAMLKRFGGKAVLLARFTAFLRAVMPGMAGMVGLPYRRFLVWNAAGGIIWAGGYTLLGYAAGNSYSKIEFWAGRGSLAIGLAVAALVAGLVIRRHVADKRALVGTPLSTPAGRAVAEQVDPCGDDH